MFRVRDDGKTACQFDNRNNIYRKSWQSHALKPSGPRVQEIADELLDRVQGQGEMDLVKDYAYHLPINVICDILGVPQADRAQIHVWSAASAHGLGLGRQKPEVAEHLRAFGKYIVQLVADKRQHPADDLISQLIAIEEEGIGSCSR